MAFRGSCRLRAASVAGFMLALAVMLPTFASAAPTAKPPRPTIDSVQQQLRELAVTSDQLVEQYNRANIAYAATKVTADNAATDYRAAALALRSAREQLSASASAQYEGGSFSAAGALLSSDSGSSYLDQLDTLSMLSSHTAQIVSMYDATQKAAKDAESTASDSYAQAEATRQILAAQRIETTHQIDRYTTLLASLTAQQRAELAKRAARAKVSARQIVKIKSVRITSAPVQKAVAFALAQLGKPYVWGAAGPGSYDCSGLTMSAYQAAGISLPHSAADQYNYGHHVGADDLRPGDLMFYYQPIGHVAIYIGNGLMVSAPQTGENVKIVPIAQYTSDFTGATRLVG